MENGSSEKAIFSDEIIAFSKLTDVIFDKISKDVKNLKKELDDSNSTKDISLLKKNMKITVDGLSKDISSLKISIRVNANNFDKKIKKINNLINNQNSEINKIKTSIVRVENKLKIKD